MEEISVLTPNFYLLFYHGFLEKAQNTPNALLLPAVVIILVPRLEAFSILLSSAQIEQDKSFFFAATQQSVNTNKNLQKHKILTIKRKP